MDNSSTQSYLEDVKLNFECTKAQPQQYRVIIFLLEMFLYMARWQLSTFTMTPVILFAKWLGIINSWEQVALANLVNAPIFYFIDKFILVHLRKKIQEAIDYFKLKRASNKKAAA